MADERFEDAVRERALELYLQNKSIRQIAHMLTSEIGRKISPSTINAWARRSEPPWQVLKAESKSVALSILTGKAGQEIAERANEHLEDYEHIRNKAMDELDLTAFEKAGDAARAADMAIKGEREIQRGLINLQFVQDIFSIIAEEVPDEATQRRIALRFRQRATEEAQFDA